MEQLKCRLLDVVDENNMLHVELKSSVVDDIARTADRPPLTPVISMLTPPGSAPTHPPPNHFTVQKWQTELVVPLHFRLHYLAVMVQIVASNCHYVLIC